MKKMKRLALAAAAVAMLVPSCTLEEVMVPVTFTTGAESGSLTRSRQDIIQEMVRSRVPALSLDIVSKKSGTEYQAATDDQLLLPVGPYQVTGGHHPETFSLAPGVGVGTIPEVLVSQVVEVSPEVLTYPLDASFNCFGLVIETAEVSQAETTYSLGSYPLPFFIRDGYGLIFVNGDLADGVLEVTTSPQSYDTGDRRTFKLSAIPREGCIVVEKGKYYVLHPSEVEKVQSGFLVNLPTMGEVDLR